MKPFHSILAVVERELANVSGNRTIRQVAYAGSIVVDIAHRR